MGGCWRLIHLDHCWGLWTRRRRPSNHSMPLSYPVTTLSLQSHVKPAWTTIEGVWYISPARAISLPTPNPLYLTHLPSLLPLLFPSPICMRTPCRYLHFPPSSLLPHPPSPSTQKQRKESLTYRQDHISSYSAVDARVAGGAYGNILLGPWRGGVRVSCVILLLKRKVSVEKGGWGRE